MIKNTCNFCKRIFDVWPYEKDRKFCSGKCYGLSKRRIESVKCEICGKEMKFNPCKAKVRRFCSSICMGIDKRKQVIKECVICKTKFASSQKHSEGRSCCSKECSAIRRTKAPRLGRQGYIKQKNPNTGEPLQHRKIAEDCLGRKLKRFELVHHINNNKTDNRIENLFVFIDATDHQAWHRLLRRYGANLISLKSNLHN